MICYLKAVLIILMILKKKKGSVAQTIVNHIDTILHNKGDDNINIFVRRSFSEDFWRWLNDSAKYV